MACEIKQLGDATVIFCHRGRKHPVYCRWCDQPSSRLCDFVVQRETDLCKQKTCDAPMCAAHAVRIGPNRDYCPDCVQRAGLAVTGNLFDSASPAVKGGGV